LRDRLDDAGVRGADAVFLAAGGAGNSVLDVAVRLGKVVARKRNTLS
jgi:hypothetical protein